MEKQIENHIEENLPGEAGQTALKFVEFLRLNDMEFIKDNGYWKDKIYYIVEFKGSCVCFIAIRDPDEPENIWTVWSDDSKSYEAPDVEENIRNIAWKYVDYCGNCGSCNGGKRKTVFGKSFDMVCGCTFRIDNAKPDDLPFLRKMAELRKNDISGNL